MLAVWRRAGQGSGVFLANQPTGSQWIFDKVVARAPGSYLALGLLNAGDNAAGVSALAAELARFDAWSFAGWELPGEAIFSRVKNNLWKVVTPNGLPGAALPFGLAFRRGLGVLGEAWRFWRSAGCVCWRRCAWRAGRWNLLDLMAVPLVLGTEVDLRTFHPIGPAPPSRRPGPGPSLGGAGAAALRRHGRRGVFRHSRGPRTPGWPAWARFAPWASAATCSRRCICCRCGGARPSGPSSEIERKAR